MCKRLQAPTAAALLFGARTKHVSAHSSTHVLGHVSAHASRHVCGSVSAHASTHVLSHVSAHASGQLLGYVPAHMSTGHAALSSRCSHAFWTCLHNKCPFERHTEKVNVELKLFATVNGWVQYSSCLSLAQRLGQNSTFACACRKVVAELAIVI